MNDRLMPVILQMGPLTRCTICDQLDCGRVACFREKVARSQRPAVALAAPRVSRRHVAA